MAYQPIENHGVIGDMHTVALVAMDGTIDWCCLPRFDSPSVFGALLDQNKAGYCRLASVGDSRHKQMYLPDSNVLVSRFLSPDGVGEVIDFMPVSTTMSGACKPETRQIIRVARAVRGNVEFLFECKPAFDYARALYDLKLNNNLAVFSAGADRLFVDGQKTIEAREDGLEARFTLQPNETALFRLRYQQGETQAEQEAEPLPEMLPTLQETLRFWRAWVAKSTYKGRWREMVTRSALLLKLLTYQPTGAIIAAPTTGLPELVGGQRNWDYRYTWVRDAAFSVYALLRLGFTEEAGAFARFIQDRAKEEDSPSSSGPLSVLYGIDGRHMADERILDHLEGYKCSKPVRIGNAAVDHLQLDIYGELMDSLYIFNKYGDPISYEMWLQIERMLDWLSGNWQQEDRSIWEVRGGVRNFTYSKLQCWVALDRGLRLADKRSFPTDRVKWIAERDNIYRSIMEQSWNQERQAFTQFYGSATVDASVLLMPLMKFIAPSDPRMLSTLDAVQKELVSDSLVQRYEIGKAANDGLPGTEGTFSVCSFWLVECVARAGRLDHARFLFEKMLTYANHLGLYAEEIGAEGEALGNFPQAFTHLGLISAATNLNAMLDASPKSWGT